MSNTLSARDVVVGTAIAVVMATLFVSLSGGLSLIVTFVPGLVFAWLVFLWLYFRRIELPSSDRFLPVFFGALAIQFLHFAEEYVTGFRVAFPTLYGGTPYANDLFVIFNMTSYSIFAVGALAAIYTPLRFLLVPVLFFIVYGAIGNAVSHTWWVFDSKDYFPGFFTAQAYWLAGPWALYRLLGSAVQTVAVVVTFGAVLVALLATFATV